MVSAATGASNDLERKRHRYLGGVPGIIVGLTSDKAALGTVLKCLHSTGTRTNRNIGWNIRSYIGLSGSMCRTYLQKGLSG